MAVTQVNYTGNGSTTNYSFTFPYLDKTDVKVRIDGTIQPTTAYSFANATTIAMDSAPANGAKVVILRDTNVDSRKATFYAGSAIKSEDLNDNSDQVLYTVQEIDNNAMTTDGTTPMTGDFVLGEDLSIIFEGATDNAYETTLTVADPTADRTITLPNETGTVITSAGTDVIDSAHYVAGSIDLEHMSANSVDSDQYVDGSIDLVHMSANSVDSDQYVDGSIDLVHMSANSVDSDQYVDGSIDLVHMSANSVDSDQYVDGSIDGVHIADDAIDSQHYAAGSIDLEHMSADSVDSDQYVNGSIDSVHIANDQIDSQHYAAGSIDLEHMSANSVDSDQYVDGSIDRVHLSADIIDATKIADNAVTTDHIADAELTTLAGMQSGTASILADSTALTSTTTELNLLDGKSIVTSVSGSSSDVQLPTAKAVNDQILAVTNALGGFVAIADKDNFPTSNPDPSGSAGTVVSISNAAGISVNSSGVGSLATRAGGSDAVIINGFPSALRGGATVGSATNANPYILPSSVGLQVQTTSTAHTYDYHKYFINEEDANKLSGDIQDFQERYRVHAGEPSSNNDDGDLVWDTNADKMKVYDGTASAWKEVTSAGDFKYLFLCPAGGTGAPTLNGSIATYDLRENSNSGSAATVTKAAQLIVSVNGVVQKANTGTSAPAEGFALVDSNTIIFGANLESGDSVFIVQVGSAVTLNAPADNTVATATIQNLAVTGDKIATNLDLSDTKKIRFGDSSDLQIHHTSDHSYIEDTGTGSLYIDSNQLYLRNNDTSNVLLYTTSGGAVRINHNGNTKLETVSTGVLLPVTGADAKSALQINGTNGSSETAALIIESDGENGRADFKYNIGNGTPDLNMRFTADATELYYDNSKKLSTASFGVQMEEDVQFPSAGDTNALTWDKSEHTLEFRDNVIAAWGDDDDLTILHNNSNALITNITGDVYHRSANFLFQNAAGTENKAIFLDNAAVELYHNNTKTFETYDASDYSGITVLGDQTGHAVINLHADEGDDAADKWQWTAQTNGASYIKNYSNGSSYEYNVKMIGGGAVEIYYDGTKKFETASTGCYFDGHVIPGSNGGYDLGLNATRWGDVYIKDSKKIQLGDSNDLQLYHESGNSYIKNDTGVTYIRGNDIRVEAVSGERYLDCTENNTVALYYDNVKKFQTGSEGIFVYGAEGGDGVIRLFADEGDDNADYWKINAAAAGGFFLENYTSGAWETNIKASGNGAVELYYDNVKKFQTTADGVITSGRLTTNGDYNYLQGSSGSTATVTLKKSDSGADSIDYLQCRDNGNNLKMVVEGDGDLANANNSYGSTSDVKLKENIVDAGSQWADIKAVKVRNFNFKTDPDKKLLGVVAQEIETVSAGLVSESIDRDPDTGRDLGTKTKSVKYSILYMKAVKALQEAMAKIETLETKVAALEAK